MTDYSCYAELQATSHFSFLRGASSCEELFTEAAVHGIEAVAVVDRNSLAGIVRAFEAARISGVRLIVGCRLDLADGMSVLIYPTDRAAYGRLCRLLSLGKKRGGKARCILEWADLVAYSDGMIAILIPDEAEAVARTLEIATRCRFDLKELAYQYPEERDDTALTPEETLRSSFGKALKRGILRVYQTAFGRH